MFAVETFDDEHSLCAVRLDLDIGGVEAERAQECQAEVLILDAFGEVHGAAGQLSNLRLENVSGRGGAVRLEPSILVAEEGGLVLNAGERDPEMRVAV